MFSGGNSWTRSLSRERVMCKVRDGDWEPVPVQNRKVLKETSWFPYGRTGSSIRVREEKRPTTLDGTRFTINIVRQKEEEVDGKEEEEMEEQEKKRTDQLLHCCSMSTCLSLWSVYY